MHIKGANLNLYEHDEDSLKFQKNDVCHLEFFENVYFTDQNFKLIAC